MASTRTDPSAGAVNERLAAFELASTIVPEFKSMVEDIEIPSASESPLTAECLKVIIVPPEPET
jgi:hypothetical protein